MTSQATSQSAARTGTRLLFARALRSGMGLALHLLLPLSLALGAMTAQAATATRTSAFEYDPVSGLIVKEIIEPDSSTLCLVTSYTYDAYGNKTSATTRNCNGAAGSNPGINSEAAAPAAGSDAVIETRTSSTTYDAQGRFPVTSTNALSQSETKVIDGKFGVVTSLTGPNGLTTTWTYDSFGRKLSETRADGTSSQQAYALCDASCPTNGKYTITASQAGAPTSKTTYDMYGRAIQNDTQSLDGSTLISRTEYDKLGRTSRSYRPAKVGVTAVSTSITYDTLNRPVSTLAPDNSVTSVAYNGFTTVTTNALSQTRVEVKNSQGQLVSVTDAQSHTLSYQYDAFGNLTQTTDAAGNIITISYDIRGRKTAMNDPDQGAWSYTYDALGQLKKQTDAKNQNTTFTYDKLGRMLTRAEPDLNSTWIYDVCDATLNPGGKCVGKPVRESSDNGYIRTYLYDVYGRPTAELDNVDTGYGVAKNYDSFGRVGTLVYPTGLQVSNVYSTTGYLTQVKNTSTGTIYWQANTTDNEGRINQFTYGNNVVSNLTYNANTGLLTGVSAGAGGSVSNQTFVYDSIGNLTQRYDGATGLNESFGYDSLNRLTATSAVSGANTTNVTVTYNAIGNIISKSDVGTYTYGAKPHAVTSITMMDGVTNYATYTYDANGNMTSGKGRTLGWTSWNMPTSITNGANTFGFVYNSAHERVKETGPTYTIYNVSPRLDIGIHVEKRVKVSDGSIEYVNSLYASGMPFGTVTTNAAGTITKTRYFHTDHLGSIIAITDETGTVLERRSYDAWGKRRNQNGTPLTGIMSTPEERHGFTGQEELSELGLVHMNGRLYDSTIGRFISADPVIQMPGDMQNYNRYSYINNNPLSAVDYSGHGFLSGIIHAITSVFKAVAHVVKAVLSNPVVRTIAIAAASWYVGGLFGNMYWMSTTTPSLIVQGAIQGATAGFVTGFVASGGDIKAGLVGAVSGAAFGGINGYFGNDWTLGRVAANSIAGGISAKLQGGKFVDGLRFDFVVSALTYINLSMRSAAIENSSLNPDNLSGESAGLNDDMVKVAGARHEVDPINGSYVTCDSWMGGCQGAPIPGSNDVRSSFFGFAYEPGSWMDRINEAFAGPHDWFRNLTGSYDEIGNSRHFTGWSLTLDNFRNYALVAPAAPFAAAALIPPSFYATFTVDMTKRRR